MGQISIEKAFGAEEGLNLSMGRTWAALSEIGGVVFGSTSSRLESALGWWTDFGFEARNPRYLTVRAPSVLIKPSISTISA
jgi:hypothetical protein